MLVWSIVLFCLGILAVLDSQFNYGYVFRSANSLAFLLISLGLLIRTRALRKSGFNEKSWDTNKNSQDQADMHNKTVKVRQEEHQEVAV